VGKGEYQHLIRYGRYSKFEIIHRSALVFASLQQNTLGDLTRTPVYDALDPSEKGATSYYLGLFSAKLFAEKYLGVTWLMHLDLYRDRLLPELASGKSRRDLVGFGLDGSWYVLEAKGRTGGRDDEALRKARDQARRLLRVNGTEPRMRIGLVSSFQQGRLSIDWTDPEGDDQETLYAEIRHEDLLYDYYKPLTDLLDTNQEDAEITEFRDRRYFTTYIEEADLRIGMSQAAYRASSDAGREMIVENLSPGLVEDLPENISVGQDGVYVELGPAWSTDEMMLEPTSRSR
jgi:hypothetical protein